MTMKQQLMSVALGFLLTACGGPGKTPLLQGTIDVSGPTEINLVYDHEGETCIETLTTDSAGHFEFDGTLATPQADVVMYVGTDLYGLYLAEGQPVQMTIAGGKATFNGHETARCHFNNIYQQAFSPWAFKATPDHPFDLDLWSAQLERGYQQAVEAIAAIDNTQAREEYLRLTEARYKYHKIRILSIAADMSEEADRQEIDALIATIDPNADETRLSGLITYWFNHARLTDNQQKRRVELTEHFVAQIEAVDSVLTNEGNKRSLLNTLTSMFLMYEPSKSDIESYRTQLARQLARAPEVERSLEQALQELTDRIGDGDALPSDPVLITPDGSRRPLSAVIAGKVAYIDIWATWCMPCCKEIPFMEKVADRFKGDDRIVFVSISQDDNHAAWEKKIQKDQPQWPNYIFDKASGKEFLKAMSINAIPRFLLVGADGRLIAVDAPRPSTQEIDQLLREAIEK